MTIMNNKKSGIPQVFFCKKEGKYGNGLVLGISYHVGLLLYSGVAKVASLGGGAKQGCTREEAMGTKRLMSFSKDEIR